jgi:stage II sporulation protein D
MRRLTILVMLLIAAGCAAPRRPTAPGATVPDDIRVRSGSRVVTVDLEDYVLATVLAELSPGGESPEVAARLYEVQAIVARSYAAANRSRHRADGYDLCDTTHCQIYDPRRVRTSRFAAIAADAVRRTRGVVLTYGDRLAEGLFHADCGGSTSNASAIWGGPPVPYLIARRDDLPSGTHRHWTFTADASRLRDAFNRDARTEIGRRLTSLVVTAHDLGGRTPRITITGDQTRVVHGETLRTVINRGFGADSLLSTRFEIRRQGSNWIFEGAGFGHGVGMCQAGARARARMGQDVEEILGAYFTGAVLTAPAAPGG